MTVLVFSFSFSIQSAESEGFSNQSLLAILIISIVLIAALVTSRILVRKKVTRMMMIPSDAVKPKQEDTPPKELKATTTPQFELFTAANVPPQAVEARAARIKKAQQDFRTAYFYDLFAAAGYLIFTLDDIGYKFIALFYASICTWRFLFFKDQFRANHTGFSGFLKGIKDIWLTVAHPAYSHYFALVTIGVSILFALLGGFSDYSGIRWVNIGLLLAALFHAFLRFKLREKLSKTPNLKVLVLRVFGIDDTAMFTFKGLLAYWRYFGSFFTVVDPSFVKSTVRQKNQIVPIVFITFFGLIFFEVILQDMNINVNTVNYFIVFPLVIVLSVFYVKKSLKDVADNFIKNQAHLEERLAKLDRYPRAWNSIYKPFPVMCYDNTWRMAVSAFTQQSNVILMDLRGFSEERKGCEYEINYLFDHAPVSKIVFLIHEEGLELAQKTFLKCWEYLDVHSANASVAKPVIDIFVATREDAIDIQAILDILLLKTAKPASVNVENPKRSLQ